jgi:hypothetical protein
MDYYEIPTKGPIMLFDKNQEPLTVIVTETGWEAYGPDTPWSKVLYKQLVKLGGVNESVPPGEYHFNAKWELRKLRVAFTLEPAE